MRSLLTILILCLVTPVAWTTEPYKPDVTQRANPEGSTGVDHLEPLGGGPSVPRYYYLAQFVEAPTRLETGNYLVVLKTKDGRYAMRTGTFPVAKPLPDEPATNTEVQISESFASVIYDL